jgi:hypothetical protein
MNEIEKYIQEYNSLLSSLKEENSVEQFKKLAELTGSISSGIEKLKQEGKDQEAEKLFASLEESMANLAVEQKTQLLEAAKKDIKNNNVANVVGFIADTIDLGISGEQIRQSNKALREIKSPKGIAPFRLSETIQRAITNAQEQLRPAFIDAQIAPASNQIKEGFSQDIEQAKIASGGQAGSFGAYGQVAANRRNRGAASLVPMRAQLQAEANKGLSDAARLELAESQGIASTDAARAGLDYQRYVDESTAAGELGASGRLNRRNSLRSLLGKIPDQMQNNSDLQSLDKQLEQLKSRNTFVAPDVNNFESLAALDKENKKDLGVFAPRRLTDPMGTFNRNFNRNLRTYNYPTN